MFELIMQKKVVESKRKKGESVKIRKKKEIKIVLLTANYDVLQLPHNGFIFVVKMSSYAMLHLGYVNISTAIVHIFVNDMVKLTEYNCYYNTTSEQKERCSNLNI